MAPSQSYEVTVVGGGLGGLTTALALRQRGLRVTVLEQASELGEAGAGIQTGAQRQPGPDGARTAAADGGHPHRAARSGATAVARTAASSD
ncbi:FAD-dependent oxidoreductase [Streptomyces sp. L7]